MWDRGQARCVGEWAQAARVAAKLSQALLARKLGDLGLRRTQAELSRLERGFAGESEYTNAALLAGIARITGQMNSLLALQPVVGGAATAAMLDAQPTIEHDLGTQDRAEVAVIHLHADRVRPGKPRTEKRRSTRSTLLSGQVGHENRIANGDLAERSR
jgi:transcriptional regulator with XRE-family HTH domain